MSNQIRSFEMVTVEEYEPTKTDYRWRIKVGEKISGETRRPAREHMIIDRVEGRKYHHVEEQDASGKWRIVEDHDGPLGGEGGTVTRKHRQSRNSSNVERT